MTDDVTVENLRLIRFNTKYLSSDIRTWQEKAGVPFAESCDNQIWYGHKDDFDDFPFPKGRGDEVKVMDDKDAYKFLLDTVSGFRSKNRGETHIRRQFYDGLKCLKADHPDKEKPYQGLVSNIKKDIAFIQDEISIGYKKTDNLTISRDLSGQVKGETVLIIGSLGSGGLIGNNTKKMIGLSENKQDPNGKMLGRDHFIRVSHPDPVELHALREQVETLREQGIFRSNIDYVDFSDISVQFEECDRVYIDLPMKPNDTMDSIVVMAWQERVRNDNVMTHMRGNPLKRMQSTDTWLNAGLDADSYVSPEDIIEECELRSTNNKLTIQSVDMATRTISEMRAKGTENPVKEIKDQGIDIILDPEEPYYS